MLGRYYKQFVNHIKSLHNSKSYFEFQEKFKLIKSKWKNLSLNIFLNYFEDQWVNAVIIMQLFRNFLQNELN